MCLHQPLPFSDSNLLPGRKGTLLPTLAPQMASLTTLLNYKMGEGVWQILRVLAALIEPQRETPVAAIYAGRHGLLLLGSVLRGLNQACGMRGGVRVGNLKQSLSPMCELPANPLPVQTLPLLPRSPPLLHIPCLLPSGAQGWRFGQARGQECLPS